ncbi:MAG TPA: acyclic terpene utilization AtuA family protein [Chloroflexota bacterium]|jgi:hypothetical protein
MAEMRILAPTAILGYGYPLASLERGLAADPHLIGVDGGSTDAGPFYLGEGVSFTSRAAVKRDLAPLLAAGRERRIPVVVGTAGGAGGEPHLEWCLSIVEEIARERGWTLRVALVHAEQPKERVLRALREGRTAPLGAAPELDEATVAATSRIVGQMGVEPIQKALELEPDLVLAGRACDVSIFAALPLMHGYDPGLTMHAAKIVECGAYCAEPGGASDAILAILRDDHFEVRPLSPGRRCTRLSVAAHSLYEQAHPSEIVEPSGVVDCATASFEELPDGAVRVRGTSFRPAAAPTIKLEGAVPVGHRAVSIAGVRDPTAINSLDGSIAAARELIAATLGEGHTLHVHVYGRDAVMGVREPTPKVAGHEVGLVIEAVAVDAETAAAVCALARSTLLHHHYPGRVTTGGSLAFPFSPSDVVWGRVYEFGVYHLWRVEDPAAPFPVELRTVGAASPVPAG